VNIRLGQFIKGSALIAIVGVLAFLWIEEDLGNAAVKAACERDGGLTLRATAAVPGIFYSEPGGSNCTMCIWWLASGNVEYVDFLALRDGSGELFPVRGYYRMRIGTVGDADCAAFDRAAFVKMQQDRFGLLPSQCIAVAPLPSRPVGPVYSTALYNEPAAWGIRLSVWEHRIDDSSSGEEVAVLRDYRFYSRAAPLLDFSGGGGVPHSTCETYASGQFPSVSDLMSAAFQRTSPTSSGVD
jgi:hypothetical protein